MIRAMLADSLTKAEPRISRISRREAVFQNLPNITRLFAKFVKFAAQLLIPYSKQFPNILRQYIPSLYRPREWADVPARAADRFEYPGQPGGRWSGPLSPIVPARLPPRFVEENL